MALLPFDQRECQSQATCFYSFFYALVCVILVGVHSVWSSSCDQTFDSDDQKSGSFASPNYPNPYPVNIECRYRFVGHDSERVQIAFADFDLSNHPADSSHFEHGAHRENPSCDDVDSIHVAVLVNDLPIDVNTYCGRSMPPILMSSGTQMIVTFTSRATPSASGFRANYGFVTDYGIKTGKQTSTSECNFVYRREDAVNGTFTSPNYPGLYPRNVECHYLFFGKENKDRVQITFQKFDVEGLPNCRDESSDYVEFSNFNTGLMDRKMPRLCGVMSQLTRRGAQSDSSFFRVTFKSNDVYDSTGFQASYQFKEVEESQAALQKTGAVADGRSSALSIHSNGMTASRLGDRSTTSRLVATATHYGATTVLSYFFSTAVGFRLVVAVFVVVVSFCSA